MPRYFLDIFNSFGKAKDAEGQELPDIAAARERAMTGIRSLLSEEASRGTLDLNGRIEITDDDGDIVSTVQFDEAVKVKQRHGPHT